jgi:catechol 2,3-dioxygenase-like lactoylglutathione lyase family enzyme
MIRGVDRLEAGYGGVHAHNGHEPPLSEVSRIVSPQEPTVPVAPVSSAFGLDWNGNQGGKNMANAAYEVEATADANEASVAKVDMKFEIVVIPVSDVDRAKEFYASLGWRLDADHDNGRDFRVIQFTPPGSGCSVIFGKNVTGADPGSVQGLYLIVADIKAAREDLLRRGVKVSEVFHGAPEASVGPDEPYLHGRIRIHGPDPEHRSYRSFASFRDPDGNGWFLQKSRRDCPDVSTPRRRASPQRMIWQERFGVRKPLTASTRSGLGNATRTGRNGTPPTW